jgi:hypothetical protein
MMNMYKHLVGKPKGRRPLEIPKTIWEDNIKIYLKGIGCKHVDLLYLSLVEIQCQSVLDMGINLEVP